MAIQTAVFERENPRKGQLCLQNLRVELGKISWVSAPTATAASSGVGSKPIGLKRHSLMRWPHDLDRDAKAGSWSELEAAASGLSTWNASALPRCARDLQSAHEHWQVRYSPGRDPNTGRDTLRLTSRLTNFSRKNSTTIHPFNQRL